MKKRSSLSVFLVLGSLFAGLQYRLWNGPGSFPAGHALEAKIEAQRKENVGLYERNDQLYAEILELKSGLETVEERARRELGMVKPGETLYQLPDMADSH
ncbi:septum formation initiator family protein [Pseudomonas putida]|uniref:Cell division protein FtsB n=1 Tax=Pseudomonas putida TaxID=303 RepID=A0A8I1JIA9_PSEPU|nr:septum formation initiator family protein [Pseudomonas putida]MBI6882788.1 septum formation initiator family protein [Pseudomonas putida]